MAEERNIEPVLRQAAAEPPDLHTKSEIETWWKKYCLDVGHRRLGQLMIGRTADAILKSRSRVED